MSDDPYRASTVTMPSTATRQPVGLVGTWLLPMCCGVLSPLLVLSAFALASGDPIPRLLVPGMLIVAVVCAALATLMLRPFGQLRWPWRACLAGVLSVLTMVILGVGVLVYSSRHPIEIRLPKVRLPAPVG